MGKIRVKTVGDEALEKEQQKEARKRAEAKKAHSANSVQVEKQQVATDENNTTPAEQTPEQPKGKVKKPYQKKTVTGRSQKYQSVVSLVDKSKTYSLAEALALLPKLKLASFDETVELHINTLMGGVSGSVTLPHGTGKKMRIAIANQTDDPKSVEDLVKKVEGGTIDFDLLVATPDAMPKLARVARFLGPRGLMPNPKNGTVTAKPEDVAKKYEGGQVNFRTEAKFPIIHLTVGKLSFGDQKLAENAQAALDAMPKNSVRNATLKSTMSPGIKVAVTTS